MHNRHAAQSPGEATGIQQNKGLLLWDHSAYCKTFYQTSSENRWLQLFSLCTDQGYLFNMKMDHSYLAAFVEIIVTQIIQSILSATAYRDSKHGSL